MAKGPAKPKGILAELAAIKPVRGTWFESLSPTDRAELNEVRAAVQSGKLVVGKEICEYLLAKYKLHLTPGGLHGWLKK